MTETQTSTIAYQDFQNGLLFVLDEAFDDVKGAFLDPGDSLFPTLESVTAAQASRVVGSCGNSIAGQVAHMIFWYDVGLQYMRGENPGRQDWSISWQTVEVTEEEWADLQRQLRDRQQRLFDAIRQEPPSVGAEFAGGAFATVAHTAFHLGQIRHALCMLE